MLVYFIIDAFLQRKCEHTAVFHAQNPLLTSPFNACAAVAIRSSTCIEESTSSLGLSTPEESPLAAWSISAVVGAATLAGVGDVSGVDADAPIFMTRTDQSCLDSVLNLVVKFGSDVTCVGPAFLRAGPSRRKLRGVVVEMDSVQTLGVWR